MLSQKLLPLQRLLACVLVTLLLMLHTANEIEAPLLQRIEHIFYDFRLRLTLPNTIDPRIVIVTVNEDSLAGEGRWPWSRDKIAFLVDMLFDNYNISMLGFDVMFSEADQTSGSALLKKFAESNLRNDKDYLEMFKKMRPKLSELDFDEVFAKSLDGRPVVLSYFTSPRLEKKPEVGLLPKAIASGVNQPFASQLFQPQSYTANLPVLQAAARAGGFVDNPKIDDDGVYRKLTLLANYQGQLYESLALAMFRTLLNHPPIHFLTDDNFSESPLKGIRIQGFTIPVDHDGAILAPFRGKYGSFEYIAAEDILNGVPDKDQLKGKIVIFGVTATGVWDSRTTPVQSNYPGVEMHANVLSALLDQNIKARPNWMKYAELGELLLIFLLTATLFSRLSAMYSALVFGAMSIVIFGINFYCWKILGLDTVLAIPLLLSAALFAIQMFFGFFLESLRKLKLSAMFGQYVPPELVAQMSQSDEQFSLQGESRELTVFFSDVRDFTRISESMEPQALCDLMNAILTPITKEIHDTHGTIDKYMGDAVMAFWGAPIHDTEHAHYAVRSALAVVAKLQVMQAEFVSKGWPAIDLGIGINSGTMNVGNMGSEFRMAYTVMGDAVNLGSRLEGLTKEYGVKIIVSESTRRAATEFTYRELDRVRVKGKQKPITLYEPLAEGSEKRGYIGLLNQSLHHYRQQQWAEAEAVFTQLAKIQPEDKLYGMYLTRIKHYQIEPPPQDWDGVYTHTSK
jgi:adenylate cyclase